MGGLYLALASMTAQQTLATAGRSTVPLIAAAIIADLGIDAALVGVYLAIQSVAGFLTTMACGGFIIRHEHRAGHTPVADLRSLTCELLALRVVGPVAGQPLRQQKVRRHGVKVALPHGNHALGVRRHHGAHDFGQAVLIRLHQHATTDGGHLSFTRGDFESVVGEFNVVGRVALPDSQDDVNGFSKHLVAVLVQDTQRFGV